MAKKARKPESNPGKQILSYPPQPSPGNDAKAAPRQGWTSLLKLSFDSRVQRAISLVLLAAFYAPLSQIILSPVYGAVPSGIYHKYVVLGSSMCAYALRGILPKWVNKILPAFAFWIPSIHYVMFQYSTALGNPAGPLATELVTLVPLITLSMYLSTQVLDEVDLSNYFSPSVAESGPSMFSYFVFTLATRSLRSSLPPLMGKNVLFTRIGFQLTLATTYSLLLPQSLFWPALPSIAFTMVANVHNPLARTTEVLNSTLALYDYTLLERRESLTGYISVLQDEANHFRVMRCDHSLLGGNWIIPPVADKKGAPARRIAEPVYAVFTMLEAVRLVERPSHKVANDSAAEKALAIGLGVGTVPSALIAHGVETTILELDPVVHEFAVKYFDLPSNHSAYIGDAVGIVDYKIRNDPDWIGSYDYIVHDVFTGGAEPAQLFTYEFLSSLFDLLKSDGVITINYAGDLATESPSIIYRTITAVFPSCRVFREDEQIADDGTEAVGTKPDEGEFTNMVFICTKMASKPLRFRKATEGDFLGSSSRRAYMVPKTEVGTEKFTWDKGDILRRTGPAMKQLQRLQVQSAMGHWRLMKKVIPDAIWGNW